MTDADQPVLQDGDAPVRDALKAIDAFLELENLPSKIWHALTNLKVFLSNPTAGVTGTKPAPDAMREALQQVHAISLMPIGRTERLRINEICSAALSPAPVPSGDGAGEATPVQHIGRPKGEPARYVRNGKLEICRCFDCRALSPSDAGAAEPVAWRRVRNDGVVTYWETKVPDSVPLYAAPPVRGDREAIAKIIDPVTFELLKLPNCECDPNIISSWNRALTKADAILSLPSALISGRDIKGPNQ